MEWFGRTTTKKGESVIFNIDICIILYRQDCKVGNSMIPEGNILVVSDKVLLDQR